MTALATGFYSGKSKWAPGTMGTLVAIPLVYLALRYLPPMFYMAATLLFIIASIFISEWYERQTGQHDSQEIVIDEMAGFFVTMTWMPLTWQSFLAGFVLFRLLDALKPFPINIIDRKVDGGFGVVIDDVAAGLVANVLLQIVYVQTSWLGVQWID